VTVLRIDLETVAPRSALVVLTTDLHHLGEIHRVVLGHLLIPLVVAILVVVVGVMAVATSVTETETHETVTEIATFEITAMARRFAAIWTGTGFAVTAILTPETTGLALAEVAQDHRRATFAT
jgi:hypothetical protein